MSLFPKPYADFVARLRVFAGFVLVGVFAWLAHPTLDSLAMGLPVALLGLALRAWAAGCLYKNQQLTTGGPYAYIRNPLYVGTSLAAAGFVITAARWELAILFVAVFVFIYLPVIGLEEQHLRGLFPEFEDCSPSRSTSTTANTKRWPASWPGRRSWCGKLSRRQGRDPPRPSLPAPPVPRVDVH
ncbi:MAG: hypothetical protein MUC42_09100 [Bryobacter sp.]|nr:hypothetical protein [Bryobacter sp.]